MNNQEVNKYIQKVNGEVNEVFEGRIMQCFKEDSVAGFSGCYDKLQVAFTPLMSETLLKAQWMSNNYLQCTKRQDSDCFEKFKVGMQTLSGSVIDRVSQV